MATKYIVIAGFCPALNKYKLTESSRDTLSDMHTQEVAQFDIFDDEKVEAGLLAELVKSKFIEQYEPHTLTESDLALHPFLSTGRKHKAGDEIHKKLTWMEGVEVKTFTPAVAPEATEKADSTEKKK